MTKKTMATRHSRTLNQSTRQTGATSGEGRGSEGATAAGTDCATDCERRSAPWSATAFAESTTEARRTICAERWRTTGTLRDCNATAAVSSEGTKRESLTTIKRESARARAPALCCTAATCACCTLDETAVRTERHDVKSRESKSHTGSVLSHLERRAWMGGEETARDVILSGVSIFGNE